MSKINLIILIILLSNVYADYINLNGTTYLVKINQTCPLGELRDFINFGALNVTDMLSDFNDTNSYDVLIAMNNIINSMNVYNLGPMSYGVQSMPCDIILLVSILTNIYLYF